MRIFKAAATYQKTPIEVIPTFPLQAASVEWDERDQSVRISVHRVPDGAGSNHNYFISLSLDDVTALVALLGDAGSKTNAAALRDRLGKHVPALVKLLACATGIQPKPITASAPATPGPVAK